METLHNTAFAAPPATTGSRLVWLARMLGTAANPAWSEKTHEDAIARKIDALHAFIEKAVDFEIPLTDDVALFNFFLSEYNLEAPFDPKRIFRDGDLIEAYDRDLVNIYSNRTLFRFCSYDLETLLSNPFPVLFRRTPEVERQIFECIQRSFEHQREAEPISTIPEHEMQEHFARHSTVFSLKYKWISPLYNKSNGAKMGFLVTSEAKILRESNVYGIGFVSPRA